MRECKPLYSGAPTLSSVMYLPDRDRAAAAEFIVDNNFGVDQAKELIRAYDIRKTRDSQAKGFGSTPGECLAFKIWRDVQAGRRARGVGLIPSQYPLKPP